MIIDMKKMEQQQKNIMQEQRVLNNRRSMRKKVYKEGMNPGDITGVSIDEKSHDAIEMQDLSNRSQELDEEER